MLTSIITSMHARVSLLHPSTPCRFRALQVQTQHVHYELTASKYAWDHPQGVHLCPSRLASWCQWCRTQMRPEQDGPSAILLCATEWDEFYQQPRLPGKESSRDVLLWQLTLAG